MRHILRLQSEFIHMETCTMAMAWHGMKFDAILQQNHTTPNMLPGPAVQYHARSHETKLYAYGRIVIV